MSNTSVFTLGGVTVHPGESRDVHLKISETYTGDSIRIPMRVIRSNNKGPTVFATAGIHGDEINGTGIVHDFMYGEDIQLLKGTLLLIPIVNPFGFENHDRYLPDRRDLNRSFPGNENGSLASRMAYIFMQEVVQKCHYGVDFHSAASGRVNFPNIRGDLSDKRVKRLAEAFGCTLMINGKGPDGAFRRESCKAGCPTIILEAGEPGKIEPDVTTIGVRGLRNILIDLKMLAGEMDKSPYQTIIRKSTWVRAEVGGILRYHVEIGSFIEKGQPIATNLSIWGRKQNLLLSPLDGVVLSLATMPVVKPGEPVCQIAIPNIKLSKLRRYYKGPKISDYATEEN